MRHVMPVAVATIALALSAGACARPMQSSEPDRTTRNEQPVMLAQNGAGGPNLFALLQDIQRLQDQVRSLRGQVDTLQYQIRQNEQGQRDLYQNLDKRITALEDGGASGRGANPASGGGAMADTDPAVEAAYLSAFNELKEGEYEAAVAGFERFVQQYPETSYTDNAWYWLGEARYVERDYNGALEAFQTVVNRFAASGKVPDALYKIGVVQDEQGEPDNARATLNRVIDEHPDTDAARLARERLQALGG